MNFKEVYNFIKEQFRLTETFSTVSDTNTHIKTLINLNHQEVVLLSNNWKYETEWTITTVIDQVMYDLPSDFVRMNNFNDKDGYKVSYISNDQYDNLTSGDSSSVSDRIQHFTIKAGKLYLFPTPSVVSTMTMLYKRTCPVLSNATDTLLVIPWYEKLIPLKTLVDLYDYREEPQMAQRYEDRYERMLIKYKDETSGFSNKMLIKRWPIRSFDPNRYPTNIS